MAVLLVLALLVLAPLAPRAFVSRPMLRPVSRPRLRVCPRPRLRAPPWAPLQLGLRAARDFPSVVRDTSYLAPRAYGLVQKKRAAAA